MKKISHLCQILSIPSIPYFYPLLTAAVAETVAPPGIKAVAETAAVIEIEIGTVIEITAAATAAEIAAAVVDIAAAVKNSSAAAAVAAATASSLQLN